MATGYTYLSGVVTATVSVYCPICHTKKYLEYAARTQYHNLPLRVLCCSSRCVKAYKAKVYKLEKTLWLQLRDRKRLPSKVAQRIQHSGVLSILASSYLKEHAS